MRALRELLAALCALYLGVALVPALDGGMGAGIEDSWAWAINWLPHSPYLFGRDVNFMHGPLGYLAMPMDLGPNLPRAIAAQLALHLLCMLLLWRLFRRASPLAVLVGAALVLFGACVVGSVEYRALFTAALLAAWLLDEPGSLPAAVCALLAAALLFVKFTVGAGACALALFALVLAYATPPRPRAGVLLTFALVFAATAALIGQLALGGVQHLEPFLKVSVELGAGYSAAMSMLGPPEQLWLGLAVLAVLGALGVLLWRTGEGAAAAAVLLLVPALWLAFKHGFVRQDEHVEMFFGFASFAAALIAAHARTARGAGLMIGGGALLAALSLLALMPHGMWDGPSAVRVATLRQARETFAELRALPARRERVAKAIRETLRPTRLPDDWLRQISELGGTVDAIPADFSFAVESGLRWAPSPVIQSHVAFTPALDALQAAHYRSDRAADFLVVAVVSIDSRNTLLEMPAAWRAIRERYEVGARHPDGKRLLLRRRKLPAKVAYLPAEPQFTTPGQGVRVPPGLEDALVQLRLAPSMRGRLQSILLRVPPIFVRLRYADGGEGYSRLLASVASAGLPLGQLPRNAAELARWIEGQPTSQVSSFYLSGPGLGAYGEVLGFGWSRPAPRQR